MGFGGCCRLLTGVWHLDLDLNMVTDFLYTHIPNLGSICWFSRPKKHPWPLSPHLGLWRMLYVPESGLTSWFSYGYGHYSLICPWSKFLLSILILKVQRTSMSFKSWFGALEDVWGPWVWFCILILVLQWSLVFDTPMLWILALYLVLGCAKKIHVL